MRNSIFVILLIFICACSSSIDSTEAVVFSGYECRFDVEGGENLIDILTYYPFECVYNEDWIVVRYQKDRIRVLATPNPSELERVAIIRILCDNKESGQIEVKQQGVSLNLDKDQILIGFAGEQVQLSVECNTDWSVDNELQWITATREGTKVAISAKRNYDLLTRSGSILIKSGDASTTLHLVQEASPWYHSFEMVPVEGGTFTMGAQKQYPADPNYDEEAYIVESPVRNINIRDYRMSKYEVTQAQWVAAFGENPSFDQGDSLPVEMVSWDMVQNFIAQLNEMSGENYRLPTEAEWEYAARGGVKSSSYMFSGASVLSVCGWYYSNSDSSSHNVGEKIPNELGIYDMSGNVREWCQDWFDYYDSEELDNPVGPLDGVKKVNRGGAWTTPSENCRNSYRNANFPTEAFHDLGFRLVMDSSE